MYPLLHSLPLLMLMLVLVCLLYSGEHCRHVPSRLKEGRSGICGDKERRSPFSPFFTSTAYTRTVSGHK
jgi:hypothetical protein